jgi:hypothetical protein
MPAAEYFCGDDRCDADDTDRFWRSVHLSRQSRDVWIDGALRSFEGIIGGVLCSTVAAWKNQRVEFACFHTGYIANLAAGNASGLRQDVARVAL